MAHHSFRHKSSLSGYWTMSKLNGSWYYCSYFAIHLNKNPRLSVLRSASTNPLSLPMKSIFFHGKNDGHVWGSELSVRNYDCLGLTPSEIWSCYCMVAKVKLQGRWNRHDRVRNDCDVRITYVHGRTNQSNLQSKSLSLSPFISPSFSPVYFA